MLGDAGGLFIFLPCDTDGYSGKKLGKGLPPAMATTKARNITSFYNKHLPTIFREIKKRFGNCY